MDNDQIEPRSPGDLHRGQSAAMARTLGQPLVVGVAGGTGAGKTTVVRAIVAAVGATQVAQLSEDAYYREYRHLPETERATVNWDHPDAIEVDLLLAQVRAIIAGQTVERPVYDFAAYARAPETVRVEPRPVLIVEGILIFVEERLRQLFDVRVFVDTDADLRFIRRLQRDVKERGRSLDGVVAQYLETVRPMHLAFVEPSKRHADLIVPEGGANRVAIELLRSAILHSLSGSTRRAAPLPADGH
ncbi:MAG TPA: uridine kinase [Ktedonobacterales bacterium]|nr:uridine kinase [Ktedonobacterales bacterium]